LSHLPLGHLGDDLLWEESVSASISVTMAISVRSIVMSTMTMYSGASYMAILLISKGERSIKTGDSIDLAPASRRRGCTSTRPVLSKRSWMTS
jgi:hypothetical protein